MDQEALVEELKRLRKGRGATLGKVSTSPILCTVLVRPYHHSLEARVLALGESVQALALRNAFGYGMLDPGNLTRRRNDFAVRTDKHTDTIEAWENEMILELTHLFMLEGPREVTLSDAGTIFKEMLDWIDEETEVIRLEAELLQVEQRDFNQRRADTNVSDYLKVMLQQAESHGRIDGRLQVLAQMHSRFQDRIASYVASEQT